MGEFNVPTFFAKFLLTLLWYSSCVVGSGKLHLWTLHLRTLHLRYFNLGRLHLWEISPLDISPSGRYTLGTLHWRIWFKILTFFIYLTKPSACISSSVIHWSCLFMDSSGSGLQAMTKISDFAETSKINKKF